MKFDVVMPKMGESVNKGTIIKWHKKKGDKVAKDEILFEISTDKVDTEIPSPAAGILTEIKVYEQETVPVDTIVAVIESENGLSEKKDEESTTEVSSEEKPVISSEIKAEDLIEIVMPKMGESVMQGTIIKWHKNVGDKVQKDETLFEISTDKVDTEVPSPVDGILAEILVNEQETVDVGIVVAKISPSGFVLKISKAETAKDKRVEEEKMEMKKESITVEAKPEFKEAGAARFYSPLVLNIARKENISLDELETIEGTGIGGRVTKKDILDYISLGRKQQRIEIPAKETISIPKPKAMKPGEGVVIEPMDNMRQLIMDHMIKSRDTSVHVVGIQEVDMSRIYNYIQKNKDSFFEREGIKLTYMPFIIDAVIKALKDYPYVNASIDGTNVIRKNYINIGIAVALEPMGLIVPVIKKADEKNIVGLAKAVYDLGTRARNKKLLLDEVKDGTFTITNYGVFGTLFGNPIINQPEVAILGVGAVTKKPVVIEVDGQDTIAIRPMMYVSLCHDHRLVDGALAGKFMLRLKEYLENFEG